MIGQACLRFDGGRPAFPLGLYNTTRQFYHRDDPFDGPAETVRLEKMAEAPISANVHYWFWAPSMEVRRKYLDTMNRRGLAISTPSTTCIPAFP